MMEEQLFSLTWTTLFVRPLKRLVATSSERGADFETNSLGADRKETKVYKLIIDKVSKRS